jgi:O-6-methylguanine DNA methyltransferase
VKKTICFRTNFGWINAQEEDQYIVSISFGKIKEKGFSKNLNKLKKNILEYFSGKKIIQDHSLKIIGSPIQKKIWKELSKIPHGYTKSYGDIAKKINTSPRYVGNVCGQNKHLLIIPCHRVIRSDGQLGGFSGLGGLKLKKRLIDFEK